MARGIAELAKTTPLMIGADSAAEALAELGAVGNEALSYLARGESPPAAWTSAADSLLERADAPVGLLRIAVMLSLRKLLSAASAQAKAGVGADAGTR